MKTGTRRTLGALFVVAVLASARSGAASTCEEMMSLSRAGTTVTLAQPVDAGKFAPPAGRAGGGRGGANPFAALPAFCRVAATLTPANDSEIKIRGVAAGRKLERQVAIGRQRGMGGNGQLSGDGDGGRRRVRRGEHGHGPCGRQRELHRRSSGETDRLRRAGRARNDRRGQGRGRRVLRPRAESVLLQRVLDRRTPGADGSPALPGRLRRHHLRRARQLRQAADLRPDLAVAGHTQGCGEHVDTRVVSGAAQSGA